MIDKIFIVLKKVILAVLLIYAFNKIAISLNLFIPMNFFTIILVTVCGIPSIIMLAMYSLLFM